MPAVNQDAEMPHGFTEEQFSAFMMKGIPEVADFPGIVRRGILAFS